LDEGEKRKRKGNQKEHIPFTNNIISVYTIIYAVKVFMTKIKYNL
jgi:hypothetical protein